MTTTTAANVRELDCSSIGLADTGNDRTAFGEAELEELASSIAAVGQLTPILVRPTESGGAFPFELVAGERRLRAVRDVLKRPRILAEVRELDDEEAWSIMLEENLRRVDLDPIDEGRAMFRRARENGWSLAELAKHWRRSSNYCADRMALLALDEPVAELVRRGQLSIGNAVSLSQLGHDQQREAVGRRGACEMTGEECRRLVSGMVAIRDQVGFELGDLELQAQEYDSRLSCYVDAMRARSAKGTTDLVGPTEIADRLKVSRGTVSKWRARHADFPAPRATIGASRPGPGGKRGSAGTPIWEWADVQDWAIATGRAK